MNNEIAQWLDSWGEWLDAILVSGVSSPGTATRAMIENWRLSAQMLGFARQSDMAGDLLNGNRSNKQRARVYQRLLVEYDLLRRIHLADVLDQRMCREE